ncbi:uncharacterized protein Z518_10972 [Rhinocladiella mackenziei CBS 650.93]|uniref:Uncharacterized protein n=1 Tax=Rhinocladiella mackenziei CBS 650.93 TaxID=1442369 RepID=A0A0D2ITK8_9EURO|nr:uncharacterized protein Z518_10972 [Rhinocladiella mackenziei CBS 650.93]KIX00045.1 hypothetical protein Z518_10972 [Rhinocladiella mackenziei CBS 650.93]
MSSFQDAPFSTTIPALCTAQYSELQQERLYLHQALVGEERRRERQTRLLKKAEIKLKAIDPNTTSSVSIKSLKKSIRSMRSKLNRCVQTEQVLIESLTNVVLQMQRLKQHQLRRAHQEYPQQTQYEQITNLWPIYPSWPMMPYVSPSLRSNIQYYTLPEMTNSHSQPQGLYGPNDHAMVYQVPQTPMLRPVQYSSNQPAYAYPVPLVTNNNISRSRDPDSISPADTISPYMLSPLPTTPTSNFPPTSIPSIQHTDIVEGVNISTQPTHQQNQRLSATYTKTNQLKQEKQNLDTRTQST